jgi:hypothetical protein
VRSGWGRLGAWACLALLALAGAVEGGAASTEIALPKADVILDEYVEATGGKEAYAKVENSVTKATMEITGQGIMLNMTTYAARPNKNYTLIESDAIGRMESGTDGTIVWENSAMRGAQIKQGDERAFVLRESFFDKWIAWREIYKEAECVGVETVADKPVYKVVMTPEEGHPMTYYFDQASKLLVKADLTVENPMGTIPVEMFLEDYREADGILQPRHTKMVTMGQSRTITVNSVEYNVDLPADRFDLPAEIRALVEGEKEEPAASPKG